MISFLSFDRKETTAKGGLEFIFLNNFLTFFSKAISWHLLILHVMKQTTNWETRALTPSPDSPTSPQACLSIL